MLGLQVWLCPDNIMSPQEASTRTTVYDGDGAGEETLQESSTDSVLLQGTLVRQEGSLSFCLLVARIKRGRCSEPVVEGSYFVMKSQEAFPHLC